MFRHLKQVSNYRIVENGRNINKKSVCANEHTQTGVVRKTNMTA